HAHLPSSPLDSLSAITGFLAQLHLDHHVLPSFPTRRSSDLAASGGIQGDVLATDNNTVGMGDAGIKSAIQGSNVPNPDEAVPSFVSGAMAKAGKGLLEGTLQAGTSAVSDKLLDL